MGAAALFFFTFGRKLLAPHETRLRDADTAYVAVGYGLVAFANSLQSAFGAVYRGITGWIIPRLSKLASAMQTGLIGVNGLMMLIVLLILILLMATWRF